MAIDSEMRLTLVTPQEVTVVQCDLSEGLSKMTHAKLEIACTQHLELDEVLERDAFLDVAPPGYAPRRWSLRVGHIDFARIVEGSLRYVANLYPALWLLRFTTNTRKFRNMSSQAIIGQVLDEHRIAHRFELVREPELRKYCAQYRETNLDFILRLLEFEGIFYAFDDDGTLVMADDSPSSDPVDGVSAFELIEAEGAMSWDGPGIFEQFKCRDVASGSATVNDYNWKTPKVKLQKSAAADRDAELEIYDYPVGYRRPEQGARLAQHRLEALRVPAAYVTGKSNVPSFRPGRLFTFVASTAPIHAGTFLLTEVTHHYKHSKFLESLEAKITYRNGYRGIDGATVFRPPLATPHPHIAGCHTALVRGPAGEEIHTDQHGRFRGQFHWDREAVGTDEDSRWLRNLQETQTGMVLARVGWEQSIAYINGDPDRPIGFARDINGVMQPEYAQPGNKTRMTMKSPTYPSNGGFNEMRLEDLAGKQHFDWHAQREWLGEVGNNRTEHVGNDETRIVGTDWTHSVDHDQSIEIGGDLNVRVGPGGYTLMTEGNRDVTVGGNEESTVTEVVVTKVEGDQEEKVSGDRKTDAAEETGSIVRTALDKIDREVKGSWITQGDGNFGVMVQHELKHTISGSRLTMVKEGTIGGKIDGTLELTMKSSSLRMSEKSMGYSAKRAQFEVDGSTVMSCGDKMQITGDVVHMKAGAALTLTSGALEIAMSPSGTKVKGKMKLEAGGAINITGNKDNITG